MKKFFGLLIAFAMVFTMMGAMVAMADGEPIKVGVVNNPPSESGYREANVNDFINVLRGFLFFRKDNLKR